MFSTFNMGVGMVLVVDPADADEVLGRQRALVAFDRATWSRAPAFRSPDGPSGPSARTDQGD